MLLNGCLGTLRDVTGLTRLTDQRATIDVISRVMGVRSVTVARPTGRVTVTAGSAVDAPPY